MESGFLEILEIETYLDKGGSVLSIPYVRITPATSYRISMAVGMLGIVAFLITFWGFAFWVLMNSEAARALTCMTLGLGVILTLLVLSASNVIGPNSDPYDLQRRDHSGYKNTWFPRVHVGNHVPRPGCPKDLIRD